VRAVRTAGRLPPLTTQSAGSVCKRRDVVHLGRKEGLQPRQRRTARRQLLAAVRRWGRLPEDSVILFVRANPKPQNSIGGVQTYCSMRKADSNGPVLADTFEMQRRVLRISLQQLIVGTRELLEFGREFVEGTPKTF
jgi:hypothetical protein